MGEIEPPLPFDRQVVVDALVDARVARDQLHTILRGVDQALAGEHMRTAGIGVPVAPRVGDPDPLDDIPPTQESRHGEALDTRELPAPRILSVLPVLADRADRDRGVGVSALVAPTTCELPTTLAELPTFGFICGAAGVGKTFWAKELSHNEPGCVLAATTGIAAVNLGEGTTINSYLKFFDTNSLREAYTAGYLESILKKHRGLGLQRILLDEVSMLDGDQLTILTRAIDNVNQDRPDDAPELGLLLVGDFAQLPPVKAPFAFESAEWERYAQHQLKLTKIRRQGDEAFVRALQAVRRGAVQEALAFFGPRLVPNTLQNFPGPTVVAKNEAVDKYNGLRADGLHTPLHRFQSTRWGEQRPEWRTHIPETLGLKEGARVMVLANKNIALRDEPAEYLYTNGDLGTFLGPVMDRTLEDPGSVRTLGGAPRPVGGRVKIDRTGDEVTVGFLTRDNKIPLEPGRRKELKAQGHPERISEDGKYEIVGAITYVPLRMAYATTVHRSQGLSLDQVQVNIRDPFFGKPSMIYVAFSRARTADGLRIVGTPEGLRARMSVEPKIKEWL